MRNFLRVMFCYLILGSVSSYAVDVVSWRGKTRDGIYADEKGLLQTWDEKQPELLWSTEGIGKGFSGPLIVDDLLYITGTQDDVEHLYCLDKTGKILWDMPYGKAYTKSYKEARTMPLWVEGLVYIVSGSGEVVCIDPNEKVLKWKFDSAKEVKARAMSWGFAENLLYDDGKIFFTTGGAESAMIALDYKTGKLIWKSRPIDAKLAAYVTPTLVRDLKTKQIIGGLKDTLFSINATTGEVLWDIKLDKLGVGGFNHRYWDTNVIHPHYKDKRLFISSANNYGCIMFELQEDDSLPKVIWQNADFDTQHGGFVVVDSKIYGAPWIDNNKAVWACYDYDSGKMVYEHKWKGHSKGSIIYADNRLYCYEENKGTMALVKCGDEFEIVGEFRVKEGKGKHWCIPNIAKGVMYVRHGEVLNAYNLKK